MRITRLFEALWADVKFAERGLRKNPGFLAVVHSSAPRSKGRSDGRVKIRITSREYGPSPIGVSTSLFTG